MKKIIVITTCLCVIFLCSCGIFSFSSIKLESDIDGTNLQEEQYRKPLRTVDFESIDYDSADAIESALNSGIDVTGKVVAFVPKEVHPYYVEGCNVWAGDHLNFVSNTPPTFKEGEEGIVRVDSFRQTDSGSWILYYCETGVLKESTEIIEDKKNTETEFDDSKDENAVSDYEDENDKIQVVSYHPFSLADVQCATHISEMHVGDIYDNGVAYYSLTYVKRAARAMDTYGSYCNIPEGHEVIFLFLEAYLKDVGYYAWWFNDVEVYVDGYMAPEVDSFYSLKEDGVQSYWPGTIDGGMREIELKGYVVPKEWSQMTVFLNIEDAAWIIDSDEVTEEPYDNVSAFNIPPINVMPTEIGTDIVNDKMQVTYEGYGFKYSKYTFDKKDHILFFFTIHNSSSSELDLSTNAYGMRCYEKSTLLNSATAVDDSIDGYMNIYDLESIRGGMSAKVYVQFPISNKKNDFYMVFDTDNLDDGIKHYVYIQSE